MIYKEWKVGKLQEANTEQKEEEEKQQHSTYKIQSSKFKINF